MGPDETPPPLPRPVRGVIVLAGVTGGTSEELAGNAYLARAALRLAARMGQ